MYTIIRFDVCHSDTHIMHSRTAAAVAAVATLLLVALAATSCSAQSNNEFWGTVDWNSTLSFSDHIYKASRLLQVVEELVVYPPRGVINYRPILAVRAYDQNIRGNGAKATIVAGGLYNTTISVLFKSQRGHSVNFTMEVYTPPCY